MPEMKPIWIDGYYDTQAECARDMLAGLHLQGIKLEPVATPALTLDQIEEWLQKAHVTASQCKNSLYAEIHNRAIDDLLAQVQAWK
jgi:hypothetical protein